eukprot:3890284-Prymnesium_polylepis.1
MLLNAWLPLVSSVSEPSVKTWRMLHGSLQLCPSKAVKLVEPQRKSRRGGVATRWVVVDTPNVLLSAFRQVGVRGRQCGG